MAGDIRIYLNERGLSLPAGATARDALRAAAMELLPEADAGTALITDGRGLPVPLGTVLEAGTILRAARSSRRAADADV
ncbi:MAG: hypothetical protein ABI587_01185 [Gemmatimonadales bacterium]